MIVRTVVEEKLAACVNRLPQVLSTYIWDGAVQSETEVLLMFKTTEARVEALKSRVVELHPYEVPEFIAVAVCAGVENYLAWVRDSVKSS